MRLSGFFLLSRIGLAVLLRQLACLPLWLAGLFTLAADVADPAMPESILRPREWLPRLWSRWHMPDLTEPPR